MNTVKKSTLLQFIAVALSSILCTAVAASHVPSVTAETDEWNQGRSPSPQESTSFALPYDGIRFANIFFRGTMLAAYKKQDPPVMPIAEVHALKKSKTTAVVTE